MPAGNYRNKYMIRWGSTCYIRWGDKPKEAANFVLRELGIPFNKRNQWLKTAKITKIAERP